MSNDMKRFIFMLPLCIAFIQLQAQTNHKEKISVATTLGLGISMNTPSSTPLMWQVLGYYKLTERWWLGVGSGLSFYEQTLIPLYGDIRFQMGKQRKFTPYAELAVGHSFAPASDANGGLFINPSIGIQYSLKCRAKLQLAIGYEGQNLERLKQQQDDFFLKEFSEKLDHHMISIKTGLQF